MTKGRYRRIGVLLICIAGGLAAGLYSHQTVKNAPPYRIIITPKQYEVFDEQLIVHMIVHNKTRFAIEHAIFEVALLDASGKIIDSCADAYFGLPAEKEREVTIHCKIQQTVTVWDRVFSSRRALKDAESLKRFSTYTIHFSEWSSVGF